LPKPEKKGSHIPELITITRGKLRFAYAERRTQPTESEESLFIRC
jgi:hypothetical protein